MLPPPSLGQLKRALPFTDWSCHLFTAGRIQHIMITNTVSLYSFVMFGRGITDDRYFVEQVLGGLRGFAAYAGQDRPQQSFLPHFQIIKRWVINHLEEPYIRAR